MGTRKSTRERKPVLPRGDLANSDDLDAIIEEAYKGKPADTKKQTKKKKKDDDFEAVKVEDEGSQEDEVIEVDNDDDEQEEVKVEDEDDFDFQEKKITKKPPNKKKETNKKNSIEAKKQTSKKTNNKGGANKPVPVEVVIENLISDGSDDGEARGTVKRKKEITNSSPAKVAKTNEKDTPASSLKPVDVKSKDNREDKKEDNKEKGETTKREQKNEEEIDEDVVGDSSVDGEEEEDDDDKKFNTVVKKEVKIEQPKAKPVPPAKTKETPSTSSTTVKNHVPPTTTSPSPLKSKSVGLSSLLPKGPVRRIGLTRTTNKLHKK